MSKFHASYGGIGDMLCSSEMQAELRRRAQRVMDVARETAPYDPADTDGDHYRDHFSIEVGVQHHKTSRAYAAVVNDHEAAMSIEFGTGDPTGERTPGHYTLTRALDAAKD